MDTVSLLIQIPPEEIAFLSFILESYEGVAIARTVDPNEGLVELMVSPDYQEDMREILKDLSRQFPIKERTPAKG
ncbi:MAG: hypothetical protein A2Z08_07765 [Deltaproteobacteria bacterium RBG_16_54_11]|jgi:hypothetical protein|nr:MAG: hypothetical protein A2Z08_07765 [Deltaproteobacteria bacterium RBG_16_54_11]